MGLSILLIVVFLAFALVGGLLIGYVMGQLSVYKHLRMVGHTVDGDWEYYARNIKTSRWRIIIQDHHIAMLHLSSL